METLTDGLGYRLTQTVHRIACVVTALVIAFIYTWQIALFLVAATPVILAVPLIEQIV